MPTSTGLWTNSLDLLNTPISETEWLIDGFLPKESVILISGREGTMKTWQGLDWARAVAEGVPWLSRECQAESVLYLDAEMPRQAFLTRLQAVGASRNLNIWRWQDQGFPTRLDDPKLLDAAQQHGLIIVDSLRRFMEGLEENSATDMVRITTGLRQLTRWGATVVAFHHSPKDPMKAGYRGSTELGAGVDVCISVIKRDQQPGHDTLELTISKTRYHEDGGITLQATKTPLRPIFHEIGSGRTTASQATSLDLDELLAIIKDLQVQSENRPNQSQIIHEADKKGLGSRNTILARLRQGEGTFWQSETDGRSRVYEPVHLSNTQGHEQLDNRMAEANGPVHLSNSLPLGEVDTLDTTPPPAPAPDLSTCPDRQGVDTLDNRTDRKAPQLDWTLAVHPVGSTVSFRNPQGLTRRGTVEAVIEWPGAPEEIVYQLEGQLVPPSQVQNNGTSNGRFS